MTLPKQEHHNYCRLNSSASFARTYSISLDGGRRDGMDTDILRVSCNSRGPASESSWGRGGVPPACATNRISMLMVLCLEIKNFDSIETDEISFRVPLHWARSVALHSFCLLVHVTAAQVPVIYDKFLISSSSQ
jgi:hypothetical protein